MLKEWNTVEGCLIDIGGVKDIPTLKCLEVVFSNLVIVITGLVSLALFTMLVIGGFRWLLSGGDTKQVEAARNTIFWAIVGLVLIISAYIVIKALEFFTGVNLTEFYIGPSPTPTNFIPAPPGSFPRL